MIRLKDRRGPIDITGCTVEFYMRDVRDPQGPLKASGTCVVTDAAKGVVQYDWLDSEVDEDGIFEAAFQVTTASGKRRTFPSRRGGFRVEITDDLGAD